MREYDNDFIKVYSKKDNKNTIYLLKAGEYVMFNTGFRDKDNKLIYSRDLLLTKDNKLVFVSYENGSLYIKDMKKRIINQIQGFLEMNTVKTLGYVNSLNNRSIIKRFMEGE